MLTICRYCKQPKVKLRHNKRNKNRGYRHVDENGSWWQNAKCPDCNKKWHIEYARKHGIKPIDESENLIIKRSRDSHKTAKKFLEAIGYDNVIINPLPTGADITSNNLTFEVKIICNRNDKSFWVKPVLENRKNDDFIVMVNEKTNQVFIDTMKNHLLNCNSSGSRYVTHLVLNKPIRKRGKQC